MAGRVMGLAVLAGSVLAAGAWSQSGDPKAGAKPKPTVIAPKGKPVPPAVQKLLKAEPGPESDEVPVETPKPGADDGLPPGAKWLKEKDGRQYYLDKLDKSAPYLRVNDKTVRSRWGIDVEISKEDDKFFYFKVYKADKNPG
ncbi:MAG TPA: hypothetical protein VMW27_02275, partial [Thermoanaerobaculia bacterium]|nr:hypothetical protein [Thermoanaerobaculia bacterium]